MLIISSNKEKGLYMEYDRSTILQVCLLRYLMIVLIYLQTVQQNDKWRVNIYFIGVGFT